MSGATKLVIIFLAVFGVMFGILLVDYVIFIKEETVITTSDINERVADPITYELEEKHENEKLVETQKEFEHNMAHSAEDKTYGENVKGTVEGYTHVNAEDVNHHMFSEFSAKHRSVSVEGLLVLQEHVTNLTREHARITANIEDNKQYLENSIAAVKKEINTEISKTEFILVGLQNLSSANHEQISVSLNHFKAESKAKIEEVLTFFDNFTKDTEEHLNDLYASFKRLQELIEGDLRPEINSCKEHLTAMQSEKDKADQSIKTLQHLVDNRIFPNTFNKGYAVISFLTVVVFVSYLTFWIYSLQEKLKDTYALVSVLNKEFKSSNQVQMEKNEVPGRM